MSERQWRIGELAEATGLTVRTLHHYDEIGLLSPSERTEAGHRRYGAADVRLLYRVVALRRLGLGLDEIRAQVYEPEVDARTFLKRHVERVEHRLELERDLRDRLARILEELDRRDEPSAEDLFDILEVMRVVEQYYTPEQLADLEERRNALGEEGMRKAESDWADLIAAVEAEHEGGTDPADPRMEELVRRWTGLIEQFTGGDPGIRRSLQKMYEDKGPEEASRGMVDPELMAYMQRAIEAHG